MPGLKKKNKKKTPLILKLNFFLKRYHPIQSAPSQGLKSNL